MVKVRTFPLIDALNFEIMNEGNRERVAELTAMKIKEMEKVLREECDWDSSKKIYLTANGYYKTKKPIQICRAKKEDVIEKVFLHYYGSKTALTLQSCFEKAMEELQEDVEWKQRKSTSKKIYESNWKRFFGKYPISTMYIDKIKGSDLSKHFKRIVFELNLSRKGLNDAKTILNRTYDYAVNNDYIKQNLARNISTTNIICNQKDTSELVYTDEERERLLKVMEADFDHVASRALSLMFCLCIRSGEVRALKWSDVDWENKTIFIHGQISREHDEDGKNIYVYENQTKNRDATGKRHQRLSNRALEILKRHRKENPFGEFIFMYNGHVLEPNMLNRRLKKLCYGVNIPYMPTHKIRFWSVTKMVQQGISPTEVQAQAGHKCKQTTDYYVRVGRQNILTQESTEAMFG